MVNLYKVTVTGEDDRFNDRNWDYTGTAGNPDIAGRAAMKQAKKDGLTKRQIVLIELLGEKEFGR